ncbi:MULTISPECIES: DedA family protein [unclassified Saccharopolyspora]|uniref:DedA family protein n=1 Tax=unclassified Saccharopolyspora TaxID=2646250 RepID=UPI001CD587A3|nr:MULTISPECIES: DedA family protein [unclassified Saccharopolyspora]MCA1193180.1 DedA family protein [Saccharopolyspora sp. 6V]MCA1227844.1 DedA family protein [Saccharopolyspora sp. 6M]
MHSTALAAAAAEPTGFTGWVVSVMETLGGPGAGLIIALENVFPPIPSELILPLAGFAASRGDMNIVSAVLWTTIGSIVGALVLYWLGASLGRDRMRRIAARLPLVKVADVDRTEAWFAKHGVKAVFLGRMIPLFRSFISLPAGVEKMALPTFVLFTGLGSLIWNTLFVVAGYLLGENWYLVEEYAGIVSKVVVGAVVVALIYFVVARLRRDRREQDAADDITDELPRISADEIPTQQLPRIR